MTNTGIGRWNLLVRPLYPSSSLTSYLPFSGVTFCLVPSGVNDRVFEHGLSEWRKRNPVEVAEDASESDAS